jgi:hypothetical protein
MKHGMARDAAGRQRMAETKKNLLRAGFGGWDKKKGRNPTFKVVFGLPGML